MPQDRFSRGSPYPDTPSSSAVDLLIALHPVAVALDIDHTAVVQEPVEDSGGDQRVTEELFPLREALIGSDNRAGPLIPPADELKKQMSLLPSDRHIADFIDHDKSVSVIAAAPRGAFGVLLELADELRHGRKVDADAGIAGLDRKRSGKMGLPYLIDR